VLEQIAAGLSNREIASTLGISEHTVKFHVSGILGKLGVTSRAAAIRRAVRRGLVTL
jgi:NarL family two-component system response regulator YdfI